MAIKTTEDFEKERNKQVAKMRSVLDYTMGGVIIAIGAFLIIRHRFDFALNKKFPPDLWDILIGSVFVLYGIWRIYRGYKKNYFKG